MWGHNRMQVLGTLTQQISIAAVYAAIISADTQNIFMLCIVLFHLYVGCGPAA